MKIRWRKGGRISLINVTTYLSVLSQIKLLESLQKFNRLLRWIVLNKTCLEFILIIIQINVSFIHFYLLFVQYNIWQISLIKFLQYRSIASKLAESIWNMMLRTFPHSQYFFISRTNMNIEHSQCLLSIIPCSRTPYSVTLVNEIGIIDGLIWNSQEQ